MATPYDQLLALINQDNPVTPPFDLTNISFSNPVPNTTNSGNTMITVNALPNAEFVGSIDVYYNRIDFKDLDATVWLFSDLPFTEDITVGLLNTFRNCIFLQATDIVPLTIPDMRIGDIVVMNLTAQPNSINWVGQTSMSMFMGFPVIANFLDELVNLEFAKPNYLS